MMDGGSVLNGKDDDSIVFVDQDGDSIKQPSTQQQQPSSLSAVATNLVQQMTSTALSSASDLGNLINRKKKGPLNVIDIINGKFDVNSKNLNKIVSEIDPELEVAVIGIAGEYRMGKSFVLNFILQYLRFRSSNLSPALASKDVQDLQNQINSRTHPWLQDIDRKEGFDFKAGIQRHTTGIQMWYKPFLVRKSDGKTIAVIVMDSQGLYDSNTSQNDNVRLFTMVSLLSSCLLLNMPKIINMKQLMELNFFVNYAASHSKNDVSKLFQRLTFLIRDSTCGNLGWDGGLEQMNQFMNPDATSVAPELKQLVLNLSKAFSHMDALTLPLPGDEVYASDFDGTLAKISPKFLFHLESLVINIVELIEVRKPVLFAVKAATLHKYVSKIASAFNQSLAPDELVKLTDSQLYAERLAIIHKHVHMYETKFQESADCDDDEYYLVHTIYGIFVEIQKKHSEIAAEIVNQFSQTPLATAYMIRSPEGEPMTAIQVLEQRMNERYDIMIPQLEKITKMRKESAEMKKERENATADERKKIDQKLQQLQKKAEEMEEIIRKLREESKPKTSHCVIL